MKTSQKKTQELKLKYKNMFWPARKKFPVVNRK